MYNKNKTNTMNKEFLKMQKLAGIITEGQFKQLNEVDDNNIKKNIESLTDADIHTVSSYVGWKNNEALEGLLTLIKKVNPEADLTKKKMSLERAWENETSEDIKNATQKSFSAARGVKDYFLDNLQIFK
jgi:hypothetical protein